MHPAAYEFVRRQVLAHGPFRSVLEIGSRDINGSVRRLFVGSRYLGIDRGLGPGVDLVADGADFDGYATDRGDGSFDCVVCCEVLEHTPKAREIVANACRLLVPGGRLILTAAGSGRLPHGDDGCVPRGDGWYRNIERADLEDWLSGLGEVEIRTPPNDIQATARKPL